MKNLGGFAAFVLVNLLLSAYFLDSVPSPNPVSRMLPVLTIYERHTLQIDDSQDFSAPLVLNQTTTASQFTTSTLPTGRMWWRVRANDASGAPGAWSPSIRFEVK